MQDQPAHVDTTTKRFKPTFLRLMTIGRRLRLTIFGLLAATASVAVAPVWSHRVELLWIPLAWLDVKLAVEASDDGELAAKLRQRRVDVAMNELCVLQKPEFERF